MNLMNYMKFPKKPYRKTYTRPYQMKPEKHHCLHFSNIIVFYPSNKPWGLNPRPHPSEVQSHCQIQCHLLDLPNWHCQGTTGMCLGTFIHNCLNSMQCRSVGELPQNSQGIGARRATVQVLSEVTHAMRHFKFSGQRGAASPTALPNSPAVTTR